MKSEKKGETETHYGRRIILQLIPVSPSRYSSLHFPRSWLTVKLGNIWRQMSRRKVSHNREMKNTLIASHLAEKQSTGRREEIPSSRCILQKIHNANTEYLPLWSMKVLLKQKHSIGASHRQWASVLVPNHSSHHSKTCIPTGNKFCSVVA